MFIEKGVYPFGSGCILQSDSATQYYPFFYEFAQRLKSGDLTQYNWNLGLGSDMVATYAYYLSSPLNWLLLIWPKGLIIEFMTYSIVLRIGLSSLALYKLLEYRYKPVNSGAKAVALILSMAYAFSGYVAAYNWQIMWLDCVVLAPVIIMGLLKMQREKKSALYYISLSVAIISNYYIALMICIFVALYGLLLFVENKEGRWQFARRFLIFSVLAGATGAFLILPTVVVLSASGSDAIGFPDGISFYFNIWDELSRMNAFSKVYIGNVKWPNIYAGSFTVLLVILYAMNKGIELKKKLPRLFMVLVFLISFSNNVLDYLWHGLRFPTWFPARQSFLYIIVVLMLAYESYNNWATLKRRDWLIAGGSWSILIIISYFNADKSIISGNSFWITVALVVFYIGMYFLHGVVDKDTKSFVGKVALTVAALEVILGTRSSTFSVMERDAYLAIADKMAQAIEVIDDDSFYRVENLSSIAQNDSCFANYRSASQFNTMMNLSVADFYYRYGMQATMKYYRYNGATPLTSAILGVKYELSENELGQGILREKIGQTDDFYVYKNNYNLPVGFMMNYEKLPNLLEEVKSVEVEYNEDSMTIKIDEPGIYYMGYFLCDSGELIVTDSDGHKRRFRNTTSPYYIELGQIESEGSFIVKDNSILGPKVYRLDTSELDRIYQYMAENSMRDVEIARNSVKGRIDVKSPGVMVLTIPADKGWQIYVDGDRTEWMKYENVFLAVNLSAGAHSVELRYETPYFIIGIWISAISLLLAVLIILYDNKKLKNTLKNC